MLEHILLIVSSVCAIALFAITARMLFQQPHRRAGQEIDLPMGIPVSEIGVIERDLVNLKTVIVIADTVERPTSILSEAVEHNFQRGVKYLFLVSADRANEEQVQGYYTLFEALAQIVLKKTDPHTPARTIKDLIDIQQLPYNWIDYPYIFYRVQIPSGKMKTLAFRGDKLRKGIAAHYGRVDPASAHTIAQAIFSEAPHSVQRPTIEREQFEAGPHVTLSTPPVGRWVQ